MANPNSWRLVLLLSFLFSTERGLSACAVRYFTLDGTLIQPRFSIHSFRGSATFIAEEDAGCQPIGPLDIEPTSNVAPWVKVFREGSAVQPNRSWQTRFRIFWQDNPSELRRPDLVMTLSSATATSLMTIVGGARNACTPEVVFDNVNGSSIADPNIRNRSDRMLLPPSASFQSTHTLKLLWRTPLGCPILAAQRIDIPGQRVISYMGPTMPGPRSASSRYETWEQEVTLLVPARTDMDSFGVFFNIMNKSVSVSLSNQGRQPGPLQLYSGWTTLSATGGLTRIPYVPVNGGRVPQAITPPCSWVSFAGTTLRGAVSDDGRSQSQTLNFLVKPNGTQQSRVCPLLIGDQTVVFFQGNAI